MPVLVDMIQRGVLFLLILLGLTVFLYGLGTVQDFMDATQLLLLHITVVLGLSLGISSLYGIALNIYVAIRRKRFRFLRSLIFYMAAAFSGMVLALAAVFILTLAAGNQ